MEGKTTGADGRAGWIKTNQGVGTCIAALVTLLLLYLASKDWVYQELRDGFRLGFFTVISALAMLICAVAMIVDRHRGETDDDMARTGWLDWAIAGGAMALCYLYFELAWGLDFLIVSPFFLAGATFGLGVRPLRSAILAGLVITVVIYGLFRLIGIELPTHLIWF